MKRGSTRPYKFGQKNQWRRWLWNQVIRRSDGREQNLPILYLAGSEDLDREIASSKGVPHQNLIALDRDRLNIDKVRENCFPHVRGDAFEVLKNWPSHRKTCAVLLDFCSGLEVGLAANLLALCRAPFDGATVAINLQRGRDASFNGWRERLQEGTEGLAADFARAGHVATPDASVSDKNRAVLLFSMIVSTESRIRSALARETPWNDSRPASAYTTRDVQGWIHTAKDLNPAFYSYKSGALTFDSVVFSNKPALKFSDQERDWRTDDALARRISAMLAVRTMRMRA